MKKDERAELESQLITLYEHWEDLHDNGGHSKDIYGTATRRICGISQKWYSRR